MKYIIHLTNEKKTKILGKKIASILEKGDIIALQGDLGVGKTTLARAVIRTIADNDVLEVPSPTFSLVQTYENKNFPITHTDLYRLRSHEEIYELNFEQALEEGVLIIEWPEKVKNLIDPYISISLQYNNTSRLAIITATGNAKKRLTTCFKQSKNLLIQKKSNTVSFF
ncbi:MAG: tRNA threonylcarbamoyladenosine biosynthesis protein TsaE [Candidatus Tokpelaia sp. JSC161]|jgi:hypothetical protein|nr:MAG: tRNA threonylcarbamoyladenosine biosynthesis protein TsaE [Candidatus Tokpelaia sp. JSC161]